MNYLDSDSLISSDFEFFDHNYNLLFVYSALSSETLNNTLNDQLSFFKQDLSREHLYDLSCDLIKRIPGTKRIAITASNHKEFVFKLKKALKSRDCLFTREPSLRRTAFLFTGLGSTYSGMGMKLYFKNFVFKKHVSNCFRILSRLGYQNSDKLFSSISNFQSSAVMPALFVLEYSLFKMWENYGIRPDLILGHSVGEFAAAVAAGVFSLKEGLHLMYEMGQLLDSVEEKGAMAAVKADERIVHEILRSSQNLVMAVKNHEDSFVISGPEKDIFDLIHTKKLDIKLKKLNIPNAFHSSLTGHLNDEFYDLISKINLKAPKIHLISCVTGELLSNEEAKNPLYWTETLNRKIDLPKAFKSLNRWGANTFLEIGPSPHLTGFGKLDKHIGSHRFIPSLIKGHDDVNRILNSAASLFNAGLNPDFEQLYSDFNIKLTNKLKYSFKDKENKLTDFYTVQENAYNEFVLSDWILFVKNLFNDIMDANIELNSNEPVLSYGFDSLMAMELKNRLAKSPGINFSISVINSSTTIKFIAQKVSEEFKLRNINKFIQELKPDIKSRHLPFGLTDVQHAYLIGRKDIFDLGNVSCHFYIEIDIKNCNFPNAEKSVNKIIQRHDALRTIFKNDTTQIILKEVPYYEIDCKDLNNNGFCDHELIKTRKRMSHQVLDEKTWPLFEIKASQFSGNKTRFHISFDLLIGDGMSLMIFAQELARAYLNPEVNFAPLNISFRDFVLFEKENKKLNIYLKDLNFWKNRLDLIPSGPKLPLLVNPSNIKKPKFVRYNSRLEKEKWNKIKEKTKKYGISPSSFLVSVFSVVLNRYNSTDNFSINLTMFNRKSLHPDINKIAGDSTSIFLLPFDFKEKKSAKDFFEITQQKIYEALDHGQVSAVKVIQELRKLDEKSKDIVFPVVFTSMLPITNNKPKGFLPENIEIDIPYSIFQTPQVWIDHQVYEEGGELIFNWDVVEELFPEKFISDMFLSYCRLLDDFFQKDFLWNAEFEFELNKEQRFIRDTVNSTEKPIFDELLHTMFVKQADKNPDKTAIITSETSMSYKELYSKAFSLSKLLISYGASRNRLIGVVMEKGFEQVVSVLGILFSGAAYLPIDSNLPEERINRILKNSDAEIVLTDNLEIKFRENTSVIDFNTIKFQNNEIKDFRPSQSMDDLCYVIYTSGSTGNPKGVMIDHKGAVNTVLDINTRFSVTEKDKVICLAELGFDLSVYDIFGILGAGATLVIPSENQKKDPSHWLDLITKNQVTIWNSVPAMMSMMIEYTGLKNRNILTNLRLIMLSGDRILPSLIHDIENLAENAEIISLGGATEASIWSIYFPLKELHENSSSVPYGRPMSNQRFYVLNQFMDNCPDFVTGEIYIAGAGLSKGYLNDNEKTQISFLTHDKTRENLYKTGDIGYYRPDGNIEIIGRVDSQVKIRGHRIELEEIEVNLRKHPDVKDAVALVVNENQLAVFYTDKETHLSKEDLKSFLDKKLPDYMIPEHYIPVLEFALNRNGKIDKKAISDSFVLKNEKKEVLNPETKLEKEVYELFKTCLQADDFGINESFFHLGGDSILAIRLINKINEKFISELTLKDLMKNPVIDKLAELIEKKSAYSENNFEAEEGLI